MPPTRAFPPQHPVKFMGTEGERGWPGAGTEQSYCLMGAEFLLGAMTRFWSRIVVTLARGMTRATELYTVKELLK